jgi:DHA2 family multidrug resistance protein
MGNSSHSHARHLYGVARHLHCQRFAPLYCRRPGRSYDEVTWILPTYLVANAVVLPMSAWLSRVLGRKNYYLTSVALFTVTSFFCGIGPSLGVILFARVLQGIGGGGLAPVD